MPYAEMPSFILLNETYSSKRVNHLSLKSLITLNSKTRLLATTIVQHTKAL